MRVKFPVSYKIPPHSHPNDEVVTVISGDFHVGIGRHSMKASETA
jgi:quercetin dioxygenase-like cupin family protein